MSQSEFFWLWRSDALRCSFMSGWERRGSTRLQDFHRAHTLKATSFKNRPKKLLCDGKFHSSIPAGTKARANSISAKLHTSATAQKSAENNLEILFLKNHSIWRIMQSPRWMFGFLSEIVLDEQMSRCWAERLSVFLHFFLFPLEWLQGWLPGLGLVFWTHILPLKHLTWV